MRYARRVEDTTTAILKAKYGVAEATPIVEVVKAAPQSAEINKHALPVVDDYPDFKRWFLAALANVAHLDPGIQKIILQTALSKMRSA